MSEHSNKQRCDPILKHWEEINIHVAQLIHVSRCSAGTSVCEREYQLVNAKIRHKYTVHHFKIFLDIDFFLTIFLKDLVLCIQA